MEEKEIIDKINKLLKFKSENDTLEVKSASGGFPKIHDTISSFANTRGGIIVFGIEEKKNFKVVGVENINELQNKISELCSQKMEPPIRPIMTQIEFNDKKLLVIEILELSQREKPCYYKKEGISRGSYIRVGDNDQKMTEYEIYSFQSYRNRIDEDLRIIERAKIEDLDKEKIDKYIKNLKIEKPKFSKKDRNGILKISNIIKENEKGKVHPTLAGTMVFGEYPQQFFPQLFVACSVIPGIEMGELGFNNQRFDDNARIEGNIEEMLDETLNFLKKNMKIKIIIDENGERKNIPEYPLAALREAVVNALVHRDYSIYTEKSYIKVFKYKDRIEIENPGGLYGTNRIEQLGSDIMLEVRNSTIIQILENEKTILENRHSGIPTMKLEMRKMNLPEPKFINQRGTFKVIFYGNESDKEEEKSGKVEKDSTNKANKNGVLIKSIQVDKKSDKEEKSGKVEKHSTNKANKNGVLIKSIQVDKKSGKVRKESKYSEKVLEFCLEAKNKKEIMEYLGINSQSYMSGKILKPLIENGKLKYTNSNKNAKNQKYITIKKY